jgi:hypothetical protein
MKRPKVADMTPEQYARFSLLRFRRKSKVQIRSLSHIDSDEARLAISYHQTVVALTKPSWVTSATPDELASVLGHIWGESN